MKNIINSEVSKIATVFQNARIVRTRVMDYCVIGEGSDVVDSLLNEKSELGRRNLIRNTSLGRGSYTGTNTIIKNADIGNYTSISWNVSIGGGNHDYTKTSTYTNYWYNRTFNMKYTEGDEPPVKMCIGNDVWIGAGVNIINGVTIGDGVVIGAGAVVTKDVMPYSIVLGVPAKCERKRFSDDVIELLEQIKWWEWSEEKIIDNIDLLRNKPTKEVLKKYLENRDET